MSESIITDILALVGFIIILYALMNLIYWVIDKFIFKWTEKAEKKMIHDLITDCEDYKATQKCKGCRFEHIAEDDAWNCDCFHCSRAYSDCYEKAGNKNV